MEKNLSIFHQFKLFKDKNSLLWLPVVQNCERCLWNIFKYFFSYKIVFSTLLVNTLKLELNLRNFKGLLKRKKINGVIYIETSNKVSKTQIYWNLCSKAVSFHHESNNQINQYAKCENHFVISKTRFSTTQPRLEKNTEGKTIFLKSHGSLSLQTEFGWTLKLAKEEFSFGFCEGLDSSFKYKFPNSVGTNFAISKEKVNCVAVTGLGPLIFENIEVDIKTSLAFYLLTIDADTTAKINGFSC